jgi:hypothetical protein
MTAKKVKLNIDVETALVSLADLCQMTGLSDKTIQSYQNAGMIKRHDRYHFKLKETMRAISDYLKQTRKTRSDSAPQQELARLRIHEMQLKIQARKRAHIPFKDAAATFIHFNHVCLNAMNSIAAMAFPRDLESRARVDEATDVAKKQIADVIKAVQESRCDVAYVMKETDNILDVSDDDEDDDNEQVEEILGDE